ncbi:ankyrin repeat domain-containing protein [Oricola indica]|uniref:ankyrin repeat domain-containing protein n=1 Tax=Oricola indica TaxID=2872591 RepID=UPI003CCC0251
MTRSSEISNEPARLASYRKAAKALKRAVRNGDGQALARIAAATGRAPETARHADCLHAIAREAGYGSWPALKFDIETRALNREGRQRRLAQALFEGWKPQAERLLESDPSLTGGHLGLKAALYDRQAVAAILERDPDAATRRFGSRSPILFLTFSRYWRMWPESADDAIAVADLLIESGADIDDTMPADPREPEGFKLSALYGALGHSGHVKLARHLLERGANPDDNESFYHACELGHLDGIRLMMEHGATLNGTNAFFRMLDFDNLEGARMMLDYGADPNECPTQWMVAHRSERGNSLHHAIRRGRDGRFVDLLLDAGADPSALYLGHTAYALARIYGNRDAAQALEARGAASPLAENERFLAAAVDGDAGAADAFMPRSGELIASLHPEEQALHIEVARMAGGLERLKALVAAGFDPDYRDQQESITALHGAAWFGLADHVAFLLQFPQDLEHRNVHGANALGTAIHGSTNCPEAAAGDYERTVELLIEAGCSINPDRGDLLMGSEAVTAIIEAALEGK